MSSHAPLVSVSMVTYNHEKYIAAAIRSVLGQTFADLELIIVDDGSTDRTAQVIASFSDPRITYIHQENQGPSVATNRGVAACRGRYVALMSGDDLCYPERIEKQLEAYQKYGPCLLFGDVSFVSEDGSPAPFGHHYTGVFDTSPKSREEIYHRFFFRGNFLNSITTFTERHLLPDPPTDPVLYQLQDFDLSLRMLKRYPIHFVQEPIVHYRLRANHENLSNPRIENMIRLNNEMLFIMRRFFDDVPESMFRSAFHAELRCPDCLSPEELACEQAFLFLRASHPMQWLVGLERLYALLAASASAAILREKYQFSHMQLARLLKQFDVQRLTTPVTTTLYLDTGSGFNAQEMCRKDLPLPGSQLKLEFDLSGFPATRQLRWDPVELLHCRVELLRIEWQDRTGQVHSLDPAAISSNGMQEKEGVFVFETDDPMIFLPVQGEIQSLRLEGCWKINDLFSTCAGNARLLATAQAKLREAEARADELGHRLCSLQVHSLQEHTPGVDQLEKTPCCGEAETRSTICLPELPAQLLSVLACPACHSRLRALQNGFLCTHCSTPYGAREGRPVFLPDSSAVKIMTDDQPGISLPEDSLNWLTWLGGIALNLGAGSTSLKLNNCIELDCSLFRHTDVLADAHMLPFSDNAFDAVISINTFEYLSDPKQVAAEVFRVLKPGGTLVVDSVFLPLSAQMPSRTHSPTEGDLRDWFGSFAITNLQVRRISSLQGLVTGLAGQLLQIVEGSQGKAAAERLAASSIATWRQGVPDLALARHSLEQMRPRLLQRLQRQLLDGFHVEACKASVDGRAAA